MHCLTGYADDLTVHCNITSWKDLMQAHNMIADLTTFSNCEEIRLQGELRKMPLDGQADGHRFRPST